MNDSAEYIPSIDNVFDEIELFLRRFISYPHADWALVHTVWIVHTYLIHYLDSTPRLTFLSPEPASGKTRALEVTELLTSNAIRTGNATAAYVSRKITESEKPPTLILDEIDAVFNSFGKGDDVLRSILNAGYKKGAKVGRCKMMGNIYETEELDSFCPVALAGLGKLPETIASRAINISMRPRMSEEWIEPFRFTKCGEEAAALKGKIDDWVEPICQMATLPMPNMPREIQDREADIWEPLFVIANLAGADWINRLSVAAVAAVAHKKDQGKSRGVHLLTDLFEIFNEVDKLTSAEIISKLTYEEDSQWNDVFGRPINPRILADLLRPYDISPRDIRRGENVRKGYLRSDFVETWKRYIRS